jgi:hypothetical protein
MSVTGSKVRRLTFSASLENAPTWSPDGRWIAYSSYRSGHSSIWKMRSDGGQKTRLAGPLLLDVPAWSPDGRRIAYAGVHGQIWMMNADGSGQHALTKTASGAGVDCSFVVAGRPAARIRIGRWHRSQGPDQRDLGDRGGWLASRAPDAQRAERRPAGVVARRCLAPLLQPPAAPRNRSPLADASEREGAAPGHVLARRAVRAELGALGAVAMAARSPAARLRNRESQARRLRAP